MGKTPKDRNDALCKIIGKVAESVAEFSPDVDTLGNAYEYLIGKFAAGSGKKKGEFYTPQQISTILSRIVILDSQNPESGPKIKLDKVLDFALWLRLFTSKYPEKIIDKGGKIGKIFGQEKT